MNTNNERGRAYVICIGIYFIAKAVLNKIIGGGTGDIVYATFELIALFTGLQFINYVIAGLTAFIVLYYLKGNIANASQNFIYLAEGGIDIAVAVILVVNSNIRQHFTNKWSAIIKT